MLPEINKIKGVHPGAILKRELKLRGLKNKELAELLDEYNQTISAILNERRGINPSLSIKLGRVLNIDDDYFMLIQASYDVKIKSKLEYKSKQTPNLKNIRKALFWDTNFNQIDWIKNKRAIIKRIFERGNDREINEIILFYGKPIINKEIQEINNEFLPSFKQNIYKYLFNNNK